MDKHDKKEKKGISTPIRAKARVATQAAKPDEPTTANIIETQAFPLRGLPTECFKNYLTGDGPSSRSRGCTRSGRTDLRSARRWSF
jgi:hypothetical protein